jgi:hypothetical protein
MESKEGHEVLEERDQGRRPRRGQRWGKGSRMPEEEEGCLGANEPAACGKLLVGAMRVAKETACSTAGLEGLWEYGFGA